MSAAEARPCLMQAWHAHERELQAWLASRLDDPALAVEATAADAARRRPWG